jgi:DNA-directed RNA polymerase specialized sigma24 family protein
VDSVLEELPQKDRELLRMFFLEARDKADLCKRFDVGEDYLRVAASREIAISIHV